MLPQFSRRTLTGWYAARRWTWRAVILLLVFTLLQVSTSADVSASVPAQSWLPLTPRPLEPPDHSYVSPPEVTFRWAPTEGAPRYILEINREDQPYKDRLELEVVGANTYTYSGLQPGYTYNWAVKVDFATSGSNYDSFEFTLSDTQLAPFAPAEISATDAEYLDEIQIRWDHSARAAFYLLQRRTPGADAFTDLARIGEDRTYTDKEGESEQHIQYRVIACNHVGCSPPSPIDEGWMGSCQPMEAPVLISPANGAEILIYWQAPWYNLEWEPALYSRSHIVRIFDTETGYLLDENEMENGGAGSYEVNGVVGSLSWYVFATNPVRGCPDGPKSETWQYTAAYNPPPPVPIHLQATDGVYPDQIHITWDQPASDHELENWQLFRSTSPDVSTAVEVDASYSDPSYIDTDVIPGTLYHYWVEACSHADGCSEKSAPDTGYAGEAPFIEGISIYIPYINR